MKYNITATQRDIPKMVASEMDHRDFLTLVPHGDRIASVEFHNTIAMFHDLNELVIFFVEESPIPVMGCTSCTSGTRRRKPSTTPTTSTTTTRRRHRHRRCRQTSHKKND